MTLVRVFYKLMDMRLFTGAQINFSGSYITEENVSILPSQQPLSI